MLQKKSLVVQYNKPANKAETTSVTSESVQECLDDMGLNFSKYNTFKTQLQKHQCMNILVKSRRNFKF